MTQTPDQLLDEAIAEVAPEGPACPLTTIEITEETVPPVYEPFLGDFTLVLAEDRLSATITFPPLKGERRPEVRAVMRALQEKHRLVDVDEAALTEVVADAFRAEDGPVSGVIAQGTPAIDGENGRIEWLGDFFESHAIQMPNGSVDHYRHTKVSVYEGQPILQIHPPSKGTPGCDVLGRTVRARPGEPAKVEHDDTLRPDVHDPSFLVAARPGMVENARGKVSVSDVQVVEAVDFATGSIEFEGAVQIRNQVEPKFSVYGAGTVIIGGTVENAHIESKKNIQIDKGVMGRGSAVISCRGDLFIGFAREAAIHCGGRLIARRELLWCEGEVHGDLLCEAGRIVGGHWRVGGRVVIDELGSREEVTTILTLGEAPEQNRALARLTRDRKNAQAQLEEFRRRYAPILRGGLGKIADSEREALEHRKYLFERQASRTRKREYLLRSRLVQQRRRSFAWIKTKIHAGVRLRMNGGSFVHEFLQAQPGPVCVRYDSENKTVQILHRDLEDCEVGMR
jgi:uncharacterized protein